MKKSNLIGIKKIDGTSVVAEIVSENDNAVVVVNMRSPDGKMSYGTYYVDRDEIAAIFYMWEKVNG